MSKIAVILIATGKQEFLSFVPPLIESLRKFFPPCDPVLFTDSKAPYDARVVEYPHLGWPRAGMMRYHAISSQADWLAGYDYLMHIDIDMRVVAPILEEEFCAKGITAVLHPGVERNYIPSGEGANVETRRESTAFLQSHRFYYQGCFQGGSAPEYLAVCKILARNIDIDDGRGIVAKWQDESHWNCYLEHNPPAIALSPAYAFPPNRIYWRAPHIWHTPDFVPKIIHIEKDNPKAHQ
jgi:hypothetical protein